ncbi:hypothetical protein M900_0904 [Bacteriovorax sp. Seq25_V]|nr:hypothetical protein M900_0904 [Bacteriovorax sp. Seq25_V]
MGENYEVCTIANSDICQGENCKFKHYINPKCIEGQRNIGKDHFTVSQKSKPRQVSFRKLKSINGNKYIETNSGEEVIIGFDFLNDYPEEKRPHFSNGNRETISIPYPKLKYFKNDKYPVAYLSIEGMMTVEEIPYFDKPDGAKIDILSFSTNIGDDCHNQNIISFIDMDTFPYGYKCWKTFIKVYEVQNDLWFKIKLLDGKFAWIKRDPAIVHLSSLINMKNYAIVTADKKIFRDKKNRLISLGNADVNLIDYRFRKGKLEYQVKVTVPGCGGNYDEKAIKAYDTGWIRYEDFLTLWQPNSC